MPSHEKTFTPLAVGLAVAVIAGLGCAAEAYAQDRQRSTAPRQSPPQGPQIAAPPPGPGPQNREIIVLQPSIETLTGGDYLLGYPPPTTPSSARQAFEGEKALDQCRRALGWEGDIRVLSYSVSERVIGNDVQRYFGRLVCELRY